MLRFPPALTLTQLFSHSLLHQALLGLRGYFENLACSGQDQEDREMTTLSLFTSFGPHASPQACRDLSERPQACLLGWLRTQSLLHPRAQKSVPPCRNAISHTCIPLNRFLCPEPSPLPLHSPSAHPSRLPWRCPSLHILPVTFPPKKTLFPTPPLRQTQLVCPLGGPSTRRRHLLKLSPYSGLQADHGGIGGLPHPSSQECAIVSFSLRGQLARLSF